MARGRPIRRASDCVVAIGGMKPMLISGWPKRAFAAANRGGDPTLLYAGEAHCLRDAFTPSVLDLWTAQTPALDIVNELRRDRRQSLGCVGLREFLALLLQEFEFRLLFCDALRHQF